MWVCKQKIHRAIDVGRKRRIKKILIEIVFNLLKWYHYIHDGFICVNNSIYCYWYTRIMSDNRKTGEIIYTIISKPGKKPKWLLCKYGINNRKWCLERLEFCCRYGQDLIWTGISANTVDTVWLLRFESVVVSQFERPAVQMSYKFIKFKRRCPKWSRWKRNPSFEIKLYL